MKKHYSFYDSKAKIYGPLFASNTHGEAERLATSVANDAQTMIGQHPEDFSLHYFGTFDESTGKTDFLKAPEHILNCAPLVKDKTTGPRPVEAVQ